MLTCQTYDENGVLVITLDDDGPAVEDRQASLRETLYRSIEGHAGGRFALDLGAVHYMASSDIGFLITLRRRIETRQGKLVVFAVDPYVVDTLRMMKLLPFFTIAETRADALGQLAAG
jgi:anti-sigma B factor antagonist